MNRLLIVGAGGFGREIAADIKNFNGYGEEWLPYGFLDRKTALEGFSSDLKCLGYEDDFAFKVSDRVVISVADIERRKEIYEKLKGKVNFSPLIHKSAIIGSDVIVGDGSVIMSKVVVTTNVRVGTGTILNLSTQIGHDSVVGDFCSFMPSVDLGGGVIVGDEVFMGTKSMIVPRKTVASRTKISAGSVVMSSVHREGLTLYGNPATAL